MCTFAAQTFSMNMQEDKSIIEVSHVSKFFGDKTALDDVTLNVKKGEFVTILGPSGSENCIGRKSKLRKNDIVASHCRFSDSFGRRNPNIG